MLDSGPPAAPLAFSLVANPAKETIKKVRRDIFEALGGILSGKIAVSESKVSIFPLQRQIMSGTY